MHFDRHIDIQEKDLDERMHTTPWYWATNLPNVPATNLVQLGIGGWQVPRYGVAEARKRATNVLTIDDIEKMGLEKAAEIALELAWKDADAVYVSFDVDSIDCGFVPGTGWPEPGGFLPREALKLLGLVAAEGVCGLEVVEVSPPYDTSDITALLGCAGGGGGAGLAGCPRQARQPQGADRQAGRLLRRAMHDDHDHGHPTRHGAVGHDHAGPGHNRAPERLGLAQWQTPHLDPHDAGPYTHGEADLDQVEAAFLEGFLAASDPTSFLRLAGIPFTATAADGATLRLLRVETEVVADVGAVTPHLGGGSFRYDPLPARLVSRRRRLRFVYFDGAGLRPLTFAAIRQAAREVGRPD